jgi:TolB-like protein/DNA-binding winged helix-turn-helix (wHTH) protein
MPSDLPMAKLGSDPEVSLASLDYRFRFDNFEIDFSRRELRRRGMKIELKGRRFTILKILVERAGQIVTREELRQQLWSADTHVDFDANLSTALRNVRRALEDSHKDSKYIETIPNEGYRFIEPVFPLNGQKTVEIGEAVTNPVVKSRISEPQDAPPLPREPESLWMSWRTFAFALAIVVLLLLIYGYRHSSYSVRARSSGDVRVLVLPLLEAGVTSSGDRFPTALTDEIITKLASLFSPRFNVIARTTAMHYKGINKTVKEIAKELGVDYVLEGAILRTNDRIRVSVHLVEASTQSPLWAEDYDRPLGDLLSIQEDIADRIARAIAFKVGLRKPLVAGEKAVGSTPH